jgi:hypothetical protein
VKRLFAKKPFWSIAIGVFAPLLASAANINLPPQALGPSLQGLAKQSGIQIIFFSKLVEGRDAPALNGAFTPEAALTALLNGTDLTYQVLNDKTMMVAARPVAAAPSAAPAQPVVVAPLDEVEINAGRENRKLSAMRAEIEKLEDRFYAEYNQVNTQRQYDVGCRMKARPNSHVLTRVCEPAFVEKTLEKEWRSSLEGFSPRQTNMVVLPNLTDYQKNMVDVVRNHPKLLDLVKERNELAQRYEAVRKQKLEGNSFVWE